MKLEKRRIYEEILRKVIAPLLSRRFDFLESNGILGDITANELKSAIDNYGATLVPLPIEAFDKFDFFWGHQNLDSFCIDIPLYTKEEGLSDLMLFVECKKGERGEFDFVIEDLRVP